MCASSSTSATVGRRAMTASVSISSTTTPRYSIRRRGTTSRPSISSADDGAPVGLDEADDDVGAARLPPVALLEHPVGLADARAPCPGRSGAGRARSASPRGCAPASRPPWADVERVALGIGHGRAAAHRRRSLQQPVEVEVQLQDVDARLTEEPEQRLLRVALRRPRARRRASCPRAVATRATWNSAAAGLMSGIEARRRRRHEVHRDRARRRSTARSSSTRCGDACRSAPGWSGPRLEPAEPLAS